MQYHSYIQYIQYLCLSHIKPSSNIMTLLAPSGKNKTHSLIIHNIILITDNQYWNKMLVSSNQQLPNSKQHFCKMLVFLAVYL